MLPAGLVLLHGLTLNHYLVHDPYFGGNNVGDHTLVSIYIWTETVTRDVAILGHIRKWRWCPLCKDR